MTAPLRIGMVGGGFMARTHSLAYAAAPMLDPTGIPRVARVRIADVTADLAERAALALGWAESTADRTAITRAADVDLVDVVTPNFAHALVEALTCGRLRAAALDVFADEPLTSGNALCELDNVVLTPHTAGISATSNAMMTRMATRNVLDVPAGRLPDTVIHPEAVGGRDVTSSP